ncbi:uncharacterized protein TRUGW13939_02359 [Talaromyces rugulosus]|uniref:Nucleoside phosphorylase domain-containing protein n=1 Tax=Talaromyces rugulosus TaxID=121627 RepID=A0A7H8QMV0_TALRU|nr:uncharacterized protein TRUGW13939_02359 [Talaromyces rugulosus]QKX55267.1 hypothetical protein TRUGW13939_02359 [Talaromyces rugulosus]
MRPQSRNGFRIAIICALAREFDAVEDSLDERYNFTDYGKQRGDANFYCTGRIGKHNIVLVCLPEMGKRNAASIASTLRVSFANIELALLVGICGGVPFPSPDTEIILGDVIIGTKVIEYDFGKQYPGGFQLKGNFLETIGRADRDIRSILSVLNARRIRDEFQERHLYHLLDLQKLRNTWRYPGTKKDRLFKTECLHKHYGHSPETGPACALCQSHQDSICDKALKSDCDALGCTGEVVQREQLKTSDTRPRIHLGSFASGDTVMKSSKHRDRLVEQTGISGFEMEAAAISDSLRCVIIKGVSDYSDSHKNDIWQNYAAATAASCTKAFLEILRAIIPEVPSCLPISLGPPKEGEEQCHEPSYTTELDTPSEEPNYQWKISSMTSSINNMNHHIMSLEEEVSRLNNVTDPFLRKVLMSAVAATIKNNSDTFRNSRTRCFQSLLTRFRFGTIISQTQSAKQSITINGESSMQYETTTTFILYPASWLIKIGFKYGIEATTTNSKAGWKYSISPVQAVQNDSLIFRFCESGNVDAVRELFKNKEASVVDVNSDGWRPLHFATFHGHLDLAKFLISEGADRTAHLYKTEYSGWFTPACFTAHGGIEMMLLFDDLIDFHGPQSDGWNILDSTSWVDFYLDDELQGIDVLSFLLYKYRTDMSDYVDTSIIDYCLTCAFHFSNAECLRLIIDSKPEESRDYIYGMPAFLFIVREPHIPNDISQLYFDRGTDIHKVHFGETAISLSLWLSTLCSKLCARLEDNGQDLNDLSIRETLPGSVLAQENWRSDTLKDFLCLTSKLKSQLYDVNGDFDKINCDGCEIGGDIWFQPSVALLIEPYWEELKYRVKTEQCICSLLPTECPCGRSSDPWKKSSVSDGEEYVYVDAYQGSLCRFCQKIYSEKSLETREATQVMVMSDTNFVNSDGAHNENTDDQELESLRLFHLQNNTWHGQYLPGEYYCPLCLALREQIYLDLAASVAES